MKQSGMRNAECGRTASGSYPTNGRKRDAEVVGSALERYRADISRCVKCGSCSAVCPAYRFERRESYSARGRLALIGSVLDRSLAASDIFKERLATCTGCLACETACPGRVPVTGIIQAAKEQASAETGTGIINAVLAEVLKHPAALRSVAWLGPLALHYAISPVKRHVSPEAGRTGRGSRVGKRSKRDAGIGAKGRVVFFPGCAIEHFQPDIGNATINILNALGHDVVVPEGLTCCGRPLLSLGDRRAAEELAEHNAALLETIGAEAIITSCASCGLTFKQEYPRLLGPTGNRPVVQDIHEFLFSRRADLRFGRVDRSVTVHDPCHLNRGQGIAKIVRDLLRSVPGLAIREMRDSDRCCGFGGIMRLTHHELSNGIVEEKVRTITDTAASAVVTGCPGCRMQIADGLRRAGSGVEAVHTVQILEQALLCADGELIGAGAAGASPEN